MTETKKYRIGLALSGGGAKGFAHAGVLQALSELGIQPDIIAGTSAGAIVGSLFADGCTPKDIISLFNNTRFGTFATPSVSKGGLFNINSFRKALAGKLRATTFEELKTPLIVNATDMQRGQNVFFQSGTLVDKVIASCSVPIIFQPTLIDGIPYCDGGLICNFPVEAIREECEYLIGVNVGPVNVDPNEELSLLEIAQRTYYFIRKANVLNVRSQCDLLIEPPSIDNYGMFDSAKNVEIYHHGYKAALDTFRRYPDLIATLQTAR